MKRKLKTITRRLAKADKLLAAMQAAGKAIREGLASYLSPVLKPDERMPDFGLLLTLLQRRVAALARRVAICQDVLSDWQGCERFYAEERDTVAASVLENLVRLRSLVKCMFGPSGPELVGLAEATPRQPEPLLKAAKAVVARLRDRSLVLPAAATPYLEVDLVPAAEELEADAIRLEESLDERANAHLHSQAAQAVRDDIIAELDVVLLAVSSLTTCLCVLAGQDELGDKIRRTTK